MNGIFAAVDLGAESGRVMRGILANGKIFLEEKHRFPTGHTWIQGTMRWNVVRFWEEILRGLALCPDAESISVDSWGVDYVWLRKGEPLVALPFHYRDPRTSGGYQRLAPKLSQQEIYKETGIQMMELNTLVQLHEDLQSRPKIFAESDYFLTIGDYFNHLLGGMPCIEQSLASTTQVYDTRAKKWSSKIIERAGFLPKVFPEVVPSGTITGALDPTLCREYALPAARVVATCSHDTGAAVAAVPAQPDEHWAYLSSGTWSLLGVELESPCITADSEREGFTNELGVGGSVRFLKNIVGLWILQECRREWLKQNPSLDYAEITKLASAHIQEDSLIRPDDERFYTPGNMTEKIQSFCRETKQMVPDSIGSFAACILRSLACLYAEVLEKIEKLTSRHITTLHIVGGGSRNNLLNQLASNLTGRRVLAGPAEATACGNVLLQALALGKISSLAELRKIVSNSHQLVELPPSACDSKGLLEKFRSLKML